MNSASRTLPVTWIAGLFAGLWLASAVEAQEQPAVDGKGAEKPAVDGKGAEKPAPATRILGRGSIDWKKSLEEAYREARAAGKYVMIDFGAEWCSWCKKLERETYTEESVIRFVSEHFVSVKVDVDKQQDAVPRYRVGPLPTILFADVSTGGGAAPADPGAHDAHEGPKGQKGHEHEEGADPGSGAARAGDRDPGTETGVDLDFFREIGRIEGFRAAAVFIEQAQQFVDSGRALADLRKESGEHPENAAAQRAYARALFADGRVDAARDILERAIERIPDQTGLQLDLADVLKASSEHARAVELYRKVLAAAPTALEGRGQVFVSLASSLVSLAKPGDAESVLSEFLSGLAERVARDRENAPPVKLAPGEDPTKAAARARRASGEELEALFLRGYVRAVQGNPSAALADLKIAESADPLGEWGFRAGFIIQRLER